MASTNDRDEGASSNFSTGNRNDTERDLYAILHIDKNADASDIQQAYRRLTLIYHPDKHTDLRRKQLAMDIFIQVKKAYDILNDPQKRAIYDVLGMKGLQAEGGEVIARTKTTREILDDYERIAREREEKRFNQITNANSSVHITTNMTDVFKQLNASEETTRFSPRIEIPEFSVDQSIDVPIRAEDTITINATASTRKGNGSGSLTTSLRHILPDLSWFRIDFTLGPNKQIGFRYFRRLTQKLHTSVATTFNFVHHGRAIATPGFVFSVSYPLGHQLTSSLQWRTGRGSFMKGTLQYDNQRWMVSTAVQLGLVNTFAAIDGLYRLPHVCNLRVSLKWFAFGPWLEYGVDRQLTKYIHGSATVAVSSRLGVVLRMKFSRGSQTFMFPVQLSTDVSSSAVFYATVVPVLAYLVFDRLILQPYTRLEQEREQQKRDDEARENQTERRREATNAQEVLRSLVEQIQEREGPQGLIILDARYGHLTSTNGDSPTTILDVTVPLQALVKDSSLTISTTVSKCNLTGFYDPCIGEEKSLQIKYSFRSQIHTVRYNDTDPIVLPNRDHIVP